MAKARVALVSLGRHFFDTDFAQALHQESAESLNRFDLEARRIGETVTNEDQGAATAAELAQWQHDLLVVQYGTFGLWSHLEAAIGRTTGPVVLWVVPEPGSDVGRLRLNSMCGANLGANHLYLQGRWFRVVYGAPDDPRTLRLIGKIARAAAAVKMMRGARLGMIGDPPAGFYPWEARAEALQARFGIELVRIPIERLFDTARETCECEKSAIRAQMPALHGLERIKPEEIEGSLGITAAATRLAEEEGIQAAAVRCWPEVPERMGCAACLGLAMLGGNGIPAACEADVYGAVSMLALNTLGQMENVGAGPASEDTGYITDAGTGGTADGSTAHGKIVNTPALMDLVGADGSNALFWHCGAAPLSLVGPEGATAMIHPNRKVGLGLDFEFGWDQVTGARFGLDRNASERAVLFTGTRGRMPRHFNGVSTAVDVGRPAAEFMEDLFNRGFEHHYGLIGGDCSEEFALLCDMLGIPVERV